MKRSYNIKRTSFVCVALLLVALPGVAEKKEEKIVNEKYPEVLQRLKNNLKTFK